MKIVNAKKFLMFILVIIGVVVTITIIGSRAVFSYTETKYESITVSNGDTLWNIANEQKSENEYYKDKEIRYVIEDIKQINHLEKSDLKVGQELSIPVL